MSIVRHSPLHAFKLHTCLHTYHVLPGPEWTSLHFCTVHISRMGPSPRPTSGTGLCRASGGPDEPIPILFLYLTGLGLPSWSHVDFRFTFAF